MAIIPTAKLAPGMVLKSAVNDITGLLLLSEGIEICGKHITILKTWGITEVDIEGDVKSDSDEGAVIQVDEDTLCRVENELRELFAFTDLDNSPVTKKIFRLSVQHKAGIPRGV
jgi:hypothetical protein